MFLSLNLSFNFDKQQSKQVACRIKLLLCHLQETSWSTCGIDLGNVVLPVSRQEAAR